MGSRHMVYPSPRGVHVPETHPSDDDDLYRPPRRDRYSRSVNQSPRVRDVTWISSSEPTPQTPHGPPTPWLPSPQVPSSPMYRPPPSPVPTVGEHMAVDDVVFAEYDFLDPYRPQRRRSGKGLLKSLWNGLKKLSGYQPVSHFPHFPRPSSYDSGMAEEMPVPRLSMPGEETQYGNPTPSEMEEQQGYPSPNVQPTHFGDPVIPGSSPVPSMPIPHPAPVRGSRVPVPSLDASPYVRSSNIGATPAIIPPSLRRSSTPIPSPYVRPSNVGVTPAIIPGSLRAPSVSMPVDVAPAITIVSPSIPSSSHHSSIRSVHATGVPRNLSVPGSELGLVAAPPAVEDGSQTLHEPVYAVSNLILPPLDTQLSSVPPRSGDPKFPRAPKDLAFDEPTSPNSSLTSTVARFRRFMADLDHLPWVSDDQIADEYVPDQNPRSRLRKRVRQGAEPSWYNPRPEIMERPAYLSEWDMWAMQSTAGLWDGMGVQPGQPGGGWGPVYPRGYVGFVNPPRDRVYAPVIP